MKFHDYIVMRVSRSERWANHYNWLQAMPDMPDVFMSFPDLRRWLANAGVPAERITAAESAWRGYRAFLQEIGTDMPQKVPEAVYRVPGGAGVVMDAPPLNSLRALGHETRRIGRQVNAATWEWCGDLADTVERRKYLVMLHDHGSVTQFSRFPASRLPVLFARIPREIDPAAAYRAASEPVEMAAKHRPRWLTAKTPHVGLGHVL